jgi:hypothetical protein
MAVSFNTTRSAPLWDDGMNFSSAASFVAGNARVLDRRRFARLFLDGPAESVRDAVAAYRNPDGGFGHALEPDCRCDASQPAAVEMALRVMNECDAWDAALVAGACDWLSSVESDGGGVAFALPTIADGPHAPWWVVPEGNSATVIQTGQISAILHERGFSHPWLDCATEAMWIMLDKAERPEPYQWYGILAFLEHVPDSGRAHAVFDRLGERLASVVELDPDAPGEVHGPLNFAPLPGSLARRLFDDDVIDAHLDRLAAGQRDDGGWMFNWTSWSPAAELDWRGAITVDALRTLRANGRPLVSPRFLGVERRGQHLRRCMASQRAACRGGVSRRRGVP